MSGSSTAVQETVPAAAALLRLRACGRVRSVQAWHDYGVENFIAGVGGVGGLGLQNL
jgi:hypothetical protein